MKKIQTITVIAALLLAVTLSGAAFAAGPNAHQKPMFGHGCHRGDGGGMKLLGRYLQQNLMVETLSKLSGQPADSIRQKLQEQHFRALLDEYKIDRKALFTEMRAQMTGLVNQFTEKGYLTAEQGKKILENMERRAERHQLMTTLVEKGLKDGTITQQQAQLLLPRYH